MQLTTPAGRLIDDRELRQHLRVERLALRQRQLTLRKQQRATGAELDGIDARLRDIREAFALLGLPEEADQ